MRPERCHRAGFSLVEMVAAVMIFSFAVLATMEIFTLCLRSAATSANHTRAVFLAQGLMEEALVEGNLIVGEDGGDLEEHLTEGAWIREIMESETEGLYEVYVTVSWLERGQEQTFELTTLAAER